jgi:hypothetical protein
VNICSMQNQPSRNPRDEAIRAALRDGAVLAAIIAGEFQATYEGPERTEYLRVLASNVTDLGGALEHGPAGIAAVFPGRRIAVRFGTRGGRR